MTEGLRLTVKLEGGAVIGGMAAVYDPPRAPSILRRDAARLVYQAHFALPSQPATVERLLRRAIELQVDAFLLDRKGNADTFARVHRLGAFVEKTFGCRFQPADDGERVENTCGVLALHSRLWLSPGGKTWGRCSICGAGDFQCDHVPGRPYGDDLCVRTIVRWDADEVSGTIRPRDPRCFRTWALMSIQELPREIQRGAALLRCNHCRTCPGSTGPTADDLDPTSWPDDFDAMVNATVAASRDALTPSAIERHR